MVADLKYYFVHKIRIISYFSILLHVKLGLFGSDTRTQNMFDRNIQKPCLKLKFESFYTY